MIQHAIAILFGITAITPIKACWVAITLVNVVMMMFLGLKLNSWFSGYMAITAWMALIQGTKVWDESCEVMTAIWGSIWVCTLLPKDKHGRIFALSIGLVVTCVLMLAVPPPWPNYDAAMYHTRLYSTAAFLGVALGAAFFTRNPNTIIAIPWFMAVLGAGSQRGFDRWVVGIYTNLIWSGCLICWLALARRADRVVSSTPDAPAEHPQSARSLP